MNEIVISATIHDGVPDDVVIAQRLARDLEAAIAATCAAYMLARARNGSPYRVYAAVRTEFPPSTQMAASR